MRQEAKTEAQGKKEYRTVKKSLQIERFGVSETLFFLCQKLKGECKLKRKSKFEYYVEDCDCRFCLHNTKNVKTNKKGCTRSRCCCADVKRDARANGRIKREKGWNKK